MKTITKMIGAVALLASASAFSATVEVRPTNAVGGVVTPCCSIDVSPGATFSLIVHGDGFPSTAGATLGINYDTSRLSITSIVLASGSPFTGGVVAAAPWNPISILGPLVGTLPSGSFDSFQINVQVLANAPQGHAQFDMVDDQADICWSDAQTFGCVSPVTYTQANVNVVPAPAAAWLIAPAVLAAGRFSRRRKAA